VGRLLGIDIGGTKVAWALADRSGSVEARGRRPLDPSGDGEQDLDRIVADVEGLLERAGVATDTIDAIGVSAPSPQDPDAGLVLGPPNLPGWAQVAVRARLGAAFGRPVFLENDANAAALAEWRFGAGRGRSDLVYLTMSTGVGAGIIAGGRLVQGRAGGAGEVGHAPVEHPGEPCACGLRGCLEAYVGGAAWTKRLRRTAPATGRVAALAGGSQAITPVHVVAAAQEGDAFACAELERFNEYLARALVGLVFTLAPEVIVLGTIASAAGERLCFAPLREKVRQRAWERLARDLEIVPAALGEQTADLAGVCVALHGLAGDGGGAS
jgi:glucokinase